MTVRTEARDGIWLVTIARPEVRNCVDRATAASLAEAFRVFDDDDDLKVAILHGTEGCFCAGADLKQAGKGQGGNRSRPC